MRPKPAECRRYGRYVRGTWHLVDDIERLRRHLQVTNWLTLGMSWGSTLVLAYEETYATSVRAVVLAGCHDTGCPSNSGRSGSWTAITRLLNSPDLDTRLEAARNWHDWEAASILLANAASCRIAGKIRTISWRGRGPSRIISAISPGWTTASCCVMREGWLASRRCSSMARPGSAARDSMETVEGLAGESPRYRGKCRPFGVARQFGACDHQRDRRFSRNYSKIILPPNS
ncbi:proline iminopeptidase [Rhizobium grahamii CCGE 502]|uniref:Proline iminopeptidase n=1 Tax=Rhizobium grahamii CCGE 502 TaxID=990285 RepID=S3HJ32_9HYPH|nr:proline iminopeptidase [Rhizobium grahamii CCGE 502]